MCCVCVVCVCRCCLEIPTIANCSNKYSNQNMSSVHDLCVGITARTSDSIVCSILVLMTLPLQDGASALCVASQRGHDEVVKILLRAKADLNLQTNVSGCTYQNCV